jgi:hypothetical protein
MTGEPLKSRPSILGSFSNAEAGSVELALVSFLRLRHFDDGRRQRSVLQVK